MANNYDFKAGGALFQRQKKSSTSPDYGGDVTLDQDLLAFLIAENDAGRPLKLELAGWKKLSNKGTPFLSLRPSPPFQKSQGNAGQPAAGRQGSAYVPPSGQRDWQAPDDEIPF